MTYFNCFDCSKVMPLIGTTEKKCLSCGGTNGEVLSRERVDEGLETGVFFNINPATGKRVKRKHR